MDFRHILDDWEKRNRVYPDKDRDSAGDPAARPGKPGLRQLRKMPIQAELDLHGLTSAEAGKALREFLAESKSRGLKKVKIIHGKGIHSGGEGVLDRVVETVLRDCPYAGAAGFMKNREGGTGARWVILK